MTYSSAQLTRRILRGVCPLRHLSVHEPLGERPPTSDWRWLEVRYWTHMGGHHIVSCSLGCHQTFPSTATTIDRMDRQGLLCCVNKDTRALLCSVSFPSECDHHFSWCSFRVSFAIISCFALGSLSPSMSVRHILWFTFAFYHSSL